MKEVLAIIAVTALGAAVGIYIRDSRSVAAPANTTPQGLAIVTRDGVAGPDGKIVSRLTAPREEPKARVETITRSDGSSQVIYYKADGSRGMRITYGPETAGSAPVGGYIPPPPAPSGGAAPRPAVRC